MQYYFGVVTLQECHATYLRGYSFAVVLASVLRFLVCHGVSKAQVPNAVSQVGTACHLHPGRLCFLKQRTQSNPLQPRVASLSTLS